MSVYAIPNPNQNVFVACVVEGCGLQGDIRTNFFVPHKDRDNKIYYLCKNHEHSTEPEKNPAPLQIKQYEPMYMFTLECRDSLPETFGDLKQHIESFDDFILDLKCLKEKCKEYLSKYLKYWQYMENDEEFVLFYLLHEFLEVPKVHLSIKIDSKMIVTITLDGRIMDPLDCTGFLPVSCKITRWSQLAALLQYYGLSSTTNSKINGSNIIIL